MDRTVIVADLHCGHTRGLTHPSYFNEHTNEYQRWVFPRWEEFCRKYYNPDILVINGDSCDGPGVKNLGIECITTDLDAQAEMAAKTLRLILGKRTKIYVLNGSGYHGGEAQASNVDMRVSEKLGAEFCKYDLRLDYDKETIQFAHGAGGGGIMNPDAYLRRELLLAPINAQKTKTKMPTILIRSHMHQYTGIQRSYISGYVTPCWEFTTAFMEKKSANCTPDIGGLIIDRIDDLYVVYPQFYPIPSEVLDAMHKRVTVERKDKNTKYKDFADLQRMRG
jgi:hypothetical protein